MSTPPFWRPELRAQWLTCRQRPRFKALLATEQMLRTLVLESAPSTR
jgi:hypothetical protein